MIRKAIVEVKAPLFSSPAGAVRPTASMVQRRPYCRHLEMIAASNLLASVNLDQQVIRSLDLEP